MPSSSAAIPSMEFSHLQIAMATLLGVFVQALLVSCRVFGAASGGGPNMAHSRENLCEPHASCLFIMAGFHTGSTSLMDMVNQVPGYYIMGENGGIFNDLANFYRKAGELRKKWKRNQGPYLNETQAPEDRKNYFSWYNEGTEESFICSVRAVFKTVLRPKTLPHEEFLNTSIGFKEIRYSNMRENEVVVEFFHEMCANVKLIVLSRKEKKTGERGWVNVSAWETLFSKHPEWKYMVTTTEKLLMDGDRVEMARFLDFMDAPGGFKVDPARLYNMGIHRKKA